MAEVVEMETVDSAMPGRHIRCWRRGAGAGAWWRRSEGAHLPRVVQDDGAVGGGGRQQVRLHRREPHVVDRVHAPLESPGGGEEWGRGVDTLEWRERR